LQISISHAKPYVAVLVHKSNPCGVDIEEKKEKLIRLAPKFLTQDELDQTNQNINALALAWGAKEAVYKFYGRKRLIFKENIFLKRLDSIKSEGSISSELKLENDVINITLKYEQFKNHILVYTL
ncbi:MAG: 4'-phosphopantetheinyl transferase superfamily protein, partial [Cyclobacteriaceae bacterium]|nr:4'-phosphopantetheinyl transferase superfamily protein [Cyclobacteriaceae bacterium]